MNTERLRTGRDWVRRRYGITLPQILSLISVIVLLLLTIFIVNASANISSFWTPVKAYNYPLIDLGNDFFNVTAYTNGWMTVIDVCMIVFCAFTALVIIINRLAVFIALKVMITLIIAYLLRCVTLLVTSLPDSWNMGTRTVENMYSAFGRYRGGDLIYSGHTLLTVTFAHAWSSFYLVSDSYAFHWISSIIAWLVTGMILVFIVVGRTHYTIDVILSLYITTGIWWSLSYFITQFFEAPVAQMKFRPESLPPLNSTAMDQPEMEQVPSNTPHTAPSNAPRMTPTYA
ncbi:shingomyelin synthase [Nematocida sp. LUAm3]|nr:shingomyelin synthase [Nematocida sp. LUAm3]KAI5176002.1 shingomyelin synthase [Nematocida sp. LUAm2]KAI5179099.1 shingomyelin synthase [Nematocida sp. LUAm1]